jgi:hypothetical protein
MTAAPNDQAAAPKIDWERYINDLKYRRHVDGQLQQHKAPGSADDVDHGGSHRPVKRREWEQTADQTARGREGVRQQAADRILGHVPTPRAEQSVDWQRMVTDRAYARQVEERIAQQARGRMQGRGAPRSTLER